jgi:hypothetical protein
MSGATSKFRSDQAQCRLDFPHLKHFARLDLMSVQDIQHLIGKARVHILRIHNQLLPVKCWIDNGADDSAMGDPIGSATARRSSRRRMPATFGSL